MAFRKSPGFVDLPGPGDDVETEGSSAGSFLRKLAHLPPAEPPARDRTGETLGRFQLLGQIGRGGMGVVYTAFDLTLRRKVALKLLRSQAMEGGGHRQQLLREARAAAAVNHPHITTVFEVGEVEGEVFIAMELVEGSDARAWLAARPRSWRAVVDVFAMAGHGLAAAHRAGLVHHDFKPENVLIDQAGRARVADFGLAAPGALSSGPESPAAGASGSGTVLTHSGQVRGTPGYIAPEHLAGRDADARADQFAFCVALFEALEGERPYEKSALSALARGEGVRPPRPLRAPFWLRGLLMRGLAPDPELRFPNMEALLARLERARTWPRRASLAAAGGAATLALTLTLGAFSARSRGCEASAAEVPAAWASARAEVLEAFSRAAVPYAADASDRVRLRLDDWADRWSQARRAACRRPGAEVTGCLARQQADFGAALDLLRHADAQVVSRAAAIVDGLEDPRRCAEGPAAQMAPAGLGTGEGRVVAQRIAQARALLAAGKYAEGAAAGAALRRDAKGAPALEADAFAVTALLSWKAREPDAVELLTQARWAAERARRDALSAELALALCSAFRRLDDRERAREWLGHAEATLARVGDKPRLQSMALAARAQLEALQDNRAAAYELARQSVALREQALGAGHLEVAESLMLAAAFTPFDRLDEGAALARRALEIRVAALGNDHPDVAAAWERLGQLHRDLFAHARELESAENALRIRVAALGGDHPDVAGAHWGVATALAALGREPAALEHLQIARRLMAASAGPDSRMVAEADLNIAPLEAELGNVEAGLARAQAALGRLDRQLGEDSPDTVLELSTVAELLVQRGDLAAAERLYGRALRNGARRGASRPKLALPLVGMVAIHLSRGKHALAQEAAAASLAARAELYPADYPEMLPSYRALFDAALASGDQEEAKRQVGLYQASVEKWLGPDDPLRTEPLQMQALLSAATGDRPAAVAQARASLAAHQARPWQVLRLAQAQGALALALGAQDAEGGQLLGTAARALRAAGAPGSAAQLLARAARRGR